MISITNDSISLHLSFVELHERSPARERVETIFKLPPIFSLSLSLNLFLSLSIYLSLSLLSSFSLSLSLFLSLSIYLSLSLLSSVSLSLILCLSPSDALTLSLTLFHFLLPSMHPIANPRRSRSNLFFTPSFISPTSEANVETPSGSLEYAVIK